MLFVKSRTFDKRNTCESNSHVMHRLARALESRVATTDDYLVYIYAVFGNRQLKLLGRASQEVHVHTNCLMSQL